MHNLVNVRKNNFKTIGISVLTLHRHLLSMVEVEPLENRLNPVPRSGQCFVRKLSSFGRNVSQKVKMTKQAMNGAVDRVGQ